MLVLSVMLFFLAFQAWPQATDKEDRNFRIPLIGEKAPSFTAESTNGTLTFPDDFRGKWTILVSHPQDFTPVCSSELLEFAHMQDDFDKANARLIVISTDPLESHLQWKKALEGIFYEGKPTPKIQFPLVDDDALVISKEYGMIHPATNSTKDVRGVFIIDPDNTIRSVQFYPMEVGRNSEEILRTVKALQATASRKYLAPADWDTGKDLLIATPPVTDQRTENVPDGFYKLSWFMWYERSKPSK